MSEKKNFLKDNAKWILVAVLALVAIFLVVFLLDDDSSSNVNKDGEDGTKVEGDANADKNDDEDINFIVEDGVEASELGLQFGNTKYEGGLGLVTYDEEGVIIYESIREEDLNLFFNTGGGEYDTISTMNAQLWNWEEGGIYVNNYLEKVPLVKYNSKAYYIYFAFDGNATVRPEKGMRVSIQGTLTDGNGGKAKFLPVTYEYRGGTEWVVVSRKAITPQEKPAEHTTVKITGWDTERKDKNLFFLIEDNCSVKSTLTPLSSWIQGGIYVDGERVAIPVIKHASTKYYVYFGMDKYVTVDPVKGTKVGIQGTLSDGKNTTTFEPATFEYDGTGTWKLVSREQVIPMGDIRPQPKPGEKEVYIYSSARKDMGTTFFETSSNDTLSYSTNTWDCKAFATSDENSGVFVDNVKQKAGMVKHAANGYLIHWQSYGITPKVGMKVSIQGDFTMGEEKITFHPATFELSENGKWTLISREAITPEAEKPGPIVTVTVDWDSAHADPKNVFFVTDQPDSIKSINSLFSKWTDGGIYINGQKSWSHFYKHSATGYCVYLGGSNVTVTEGMTVSLQGTLSDGFNAVTINPVTFEYKGDSVWEVVSREPIIPEPEADRPEPEEGEEEVYIYEKAVAGDTTLWFETSTNDTVPYDAGDWNKSAYRAKDGGLYINGVKKDIPLIKVGTNKYLVHESYGFKAEIGMQIHIQGTFGKGSDVITCHPATFEYTESGWKLVSRDALEEDTRTVFELDTTERDDKTNIFMIASRGNDVAINAPIEGDKWTEGGIYVDGEKRTDVHIAKHDTYGYYVYLAGPSCNITPVEGMTVSIQGIYVNGTITIEFAPVTFTYTNGAWVVTSREEVKEQQQVVTIVVGAQNGGLGFTTTTADPFAVGEIAAIEGGIYVNGILSETATLEKTAANTYVINGVSAAADTIVKVEGVFGTGTQSADFFVAFGCEGSTWRMAKVALEGLLPFAEVHGNRSDTYLALPSPYSKKNRDVELTDFMYYYVMAGGAYFNNESTKTSTSIGLDASNMHVHGYNYTIEEGTTLTINGIIGNPGKEANYFLVENLSLIFKDSQWRTNAPVVADRDLTNVMTYADKNSDVGHKELLILTYDTTEGQIATSRYYSAIDGGIYVNGAKIPTDLNLHCEGDYIYIYNTEGSFGLKTFTTAGITVTEGTKLRIDGVFAHDGSGLPSFAIRDFNLVYTNDCWRTYNGEVTFELLDLGDKMNITLGGADAAKYLNASSSGRYMPSPVGTAKVYANSTTVDVRFMPQGRSDGLTYVPVKTSNFGWGGLDSVVTLEAGVTTFELGEGLYYHTGVGDLATRVWVNSIKLKWQGAETGWEIVTE